MKTGEDHFLRGNPVITDGEGLEQFDRLDILAAPAATQLIVVSPYFIKDC